MAKCSCHYQVGSDTIRRDTNPECEVHADNKTVVTNQSEIIKNAIEKKLKSGLIDKHEIYTAIVNELNVPRPTVRRVARDLRNEYLKKVKILQSEYYTEGR